MVTADVKGAGAATMAAVVAVPVGEPVQRTPAKCLGCGTAFAHPDSGSSFCCSRCEVEWMREHRGRPWPVRPNPDACPIVECEACARRERLARHAASWRRHGDPALAGEG